MKPGKNDGYILLEIIVAIAILSGGLLITLRTLSQAAHSEEILKHRTIALILLREKSSELRLPTLKGEHGDGVAVGSASGDFGDRAPGFSWSISAIEDPNLPGDWVLVKVDWGNPGKQRSVETKTLVSPRPPGEEQADE